MTQMWVKKGIFHSKSNKNVYKKSKVFTFLKNYSLPDEITEIYLNGQRSKN